MEIPVETEKAGGAIDASIDAAPSATDDELHTPLLALYGLRLFGKPPPFSRRQWRVFGITATAGFFDNYDRVLLSLALKQVQQGLGVAEARLGAMLSTIRLGYLFSLIITPFADVFGRRRLLLYTIVGYTIFTGASALAPSEAYFVACQIVARAFAGAEGTVALVILIEEVGAGVRGWAVGYLGALTAVGGGLAAGVFAFVNVIPFGWRGLFAVALVPLLLIIPLRRALPESHRFEREKLLGLRPTNVMQPLAALFRSYPSRLSMLISVCFLSNMGASSAGAFLPKYLQEAHHWGPGQVSSMFIFAGALGILGNIVAGRMSDRLGRRTMGGVFLFLAPVFAMLVYTTAGNWVIPWWILELFFDTASGTILAAYSAELFPTSYRSTAGSALSVAGTTGGALGLFLESIFYGVTGSHWIAIRYLTVFWMVSPIIVFAFFPETAGRELEEISPEDAASAAPPALIR
jgi:MFS transporter, putative metabolite:H+ symporter